MASEATRSELLRQAGAALDASARIGVHRLDETLASARSGLRRACALGQAHGGEALGGAAAALAAAADAAQAGLPERQQLAAVLGIYLGHAVETGHAQGRALPVALAAILHAWSGRACHVVCGSDFHAARDHAAMQPLFQLCGVGSAALAGATPPADAAAIYASDVVYAGARQLLSDFMRDQILLEGADTPVRRQLRSGAAGRRPVMGATAAAVIADIEAVLADDASSPVLLSAAGELDVLSGASLAARDLADCLQPGSDYRIDTTAGWQVRYTAAGEQRVHELAAMLPVYWRDPRRLPDLVDMALLARDMLEPQVHYVVHEGRVMLTDDSVLRQLGGRVWQQGPQQALEARQQVALTAPPRTVARAAFQSFFPRYQQLGGIGASLHGLQRELAHCYAMPAIGLADAVPASAPQLLHGFADTDAKLAAFVDHVRDLSARGVAVLASSPRSADLAAVGRALAARQIAFQLVDGRDPLADSATLAAAGQPGRVTLMAGASLRGLEPSPGPARRPLALLFEHWDVRRSDAAFLALGEGGAVYGARAELALRPLPMWAAWLPPLLHAAPLAPWAARVLVRLSQWHVARYASRYRQALAERESQLDEQLAFSRRA